MKNLTKKSLEEAIAAIKEFEGGQLITSKPETIYTTGYGVGRYNLGDTVTAGQIKSHGRPVEVKPFEVQPDMAMLLDASSPYNVDVETLANLWVARFGKGWVGNDAVEDMEADQVDWWRHAANRLRELGYLEMHTLASSYRVVLRIVE